MIPLQIQTLNYIYMKNYQVICLNYEYTNNIAKTLNRQNIVG